MTLPVLSFSTLIVNINNQICNDILENRYILERKDLVKTGLSPKNIIAFHELQFVNLLLIEL